MENNFLKCVGALLYILHFIPSRKMYCQAKQW